MKLTPEQRIGIEERFAVLEEHVRGSLDYIDTANATNEAYWCTKIIKDIKACRDEVLALVERLEPETVREGEGE